MENKPVIEIKNLEARYKDEVILKNVNFNVYEGEMLAIVGGSGCGKSTLLRHMTGLDKLYKGNVIIDNIDITTCHDSKFHDVLLKIGILFQGSGLISSMTIGENVALPIIEYTKLSKKSINELVKIKLQSVGLSGYEDYLPSEISGGMKKRAGLARALALNPKYLFLDEPSAGLDPVISAEIDELLLHINKTIGTTLVLVTHELESIFSIAKRIIMLDKNTLGIIATGNPFELKKNSDNLFVKNFFNRNFLKG